MPHEDDVLVLQLRIGSLDDPDNVGTGKPANLRGDGDLRRGFELEALRATACLIGFVEDLRQRLWSAGEERRRQRPTRSRCRCLEAVAGIERRAIAANPCRRHVGCEFDQLLPGNRASSAAGHHVDDPDGAVFGRPPCLLALQVRAHLAVDALRRAVERRPRSCRERRGPCNRRSQPRRPSCRSRRTRAVRSD